MINFNGDLIDKSSNSFSIENRGLHYGDALFETIKVSANKLLFWEDHYFRLMASMRILRMEIPMSFSMEFLEDEILKTLKSNEASDSYRVKVLIWRKWGGKYSPQDLEIDYLITVDAIQAPFYTVDEDSYEVELFKDHFMNSGLLSTIKSTNRLVNILGGIYAAENDYDNCLLLNENKMVVEALNGNIFLVSGYKIKTPPLTDGCLNGVLRKQIIAIINQLPDYILEEGSISPFELQKADEIFVTNVIVGIQPITKYRKKEYNTDVAKEFLPKLNVRARLG